MTERPVRKNCPDRSKSRGTRSPMEVSRLDGDRGYTPLARGSHGAARARAPSRRTLSHIALRKVDLRRPVLHAGSFMAGIGGRESRLNRVAALAAPARRPLAYASDFPRVHIRPRKDIQRDRIISQTDGLPEPERHGGKLGRSSAHPMV
jgi:hypothetical protein